GGAWRERGGRGGSRPSGPRAAGLYRCGYWGAGDGFGPYPHFSDGQGGIGQGEDDEDGHVSGGGDAHVEGARRDEELRHVVEAAAGHPAISDEECVRGENHNDKLGEIGRQPHEHISPTWNAEK